MNINYRGIQTKDYEAVKDHLVSLVEHIASINPLRLKHPKTSYRESYFNQIMTSVKSKQGTIIVALDQQKLVGCIVGVIKTQSPKELIEYKQAQIGCINDLFVVNDYRGQGIGEKLLQLMEEYFKAQHCQYSEIYVLNSNTIAHKLYQKGGYTDNLLEMLKPL